MLFPFVQQLLVHDNEEEEEELVELMCVKAVTVKGTLVYLVVSLYTAPIVLPLS